MEQRQRPMHAGWCGVRPLKQSALSADNLCANNCPQSNRSVLDKQCLRSCLHLVFAPLSDTQRQLRFQGPPDTRSDIICTTSRCSPSHSRGNDWNVHYTTCSTPMTILHIFFHRQNYPCRTRRGSRAVTGTRIFCFPSTTPQNSAGPVRRCR